MGQRHVEGLGHSALDRLHCSEDGQDEGRRAGSRTATAAVADAATSSSVTTISGSSTRGPREAAGQGTGRGQVPADQYAADDQEFHQIAARARGHAHGVHNGTAEPRDRGQPPRPLRVRGQALREKRGESGARTSPAPRSVLRRFTWHLCRDSSTRFDRFACVESSRHRRTPGGGGGTCRPALPSARASSERRDKPPCRRAVSGYAVAVPEDPGLHRRGDSCARRALGPERLASPLLRSLGAARTRTKPVHDETTRQPAEGDRTPCVSHS